MKEGFVARQPDLLVRGGVVITADDERRVFAPGYVSVAGGRIIGVGSLADAPETAGEVRDGSRMVIMPGLANGHTHLSQGLFRGLFDELSLKEWLELVLWPTLRAMDEELGYAAARLAISELLRCGVTAIAAGEFSQPNHGTIDGVLRAIHESGIRAQVSRMAIDSPEPEPASQAVPEDCRDTIAVAVAELDRLRSSWDSDRVSVMPEALGVMRCTSEMVVAMADYARRNGTSMSMHVASSEGEVAGSQQRYGMRAVEKLDDLGVLGPHLLMAHAIWLSDSEIATVARTGTRVSHNPVSNLTYATGVARLKELLDAGVQVGLGTDGIPTNNGQNFWETMKFAMLLAKQRLGDAEFGSAELAIELGTRGGAAALGLADEIGALAVGRRADLIMIDHDRVHLTPHATIVSNLVYAQQPDAVRTVIIDGRVVVDNGRVVAWDERAVIEAANRAGEVVLDRSGLTAWQRARTRWQWVRG
jgi:5-methylthioadenosine/S-adenosylhomocysteine deaminase